jgi:hypothetical protein
MAHDALRSSPCRAAVAAEAEWLGPEVGRVVRLGRSFTQPTRIGTGKQ